MNQRFSGVFWVRAIGIVTGTAPLFPAVGAVTMSKNMRKSTGAFLFCASTFSSTTGVALTRSAFTDACESYATSLFDATMRESCRFDDAIYSSSSFSSALSLSPGALGPGGF